MRCPVLSLIACLVRNGLVLSGKESFAAKLEFFQRSVPQSRYSSTGSRQANTRCVMLTLRFGFVGLLALSLGWLALMANGSQGQTTAKQLEAYKKTANEPGEARAVLVGFKDGSVSISKPINPADQAAFTQMAQYLVNRVTYPEYHVTITESTELQPKSADKTVAKLIDDLRKVIIVPPADGKITLPQEEYIRELGIPLNKYLSEILIQEKGKMPPAIIRVNAGRLLAVACESGAPALWPTVITLINNPETPPELLYYALKAAEGLLGGFDVSRLSRLAAQPEDADKLLFDMVRALEEVVIKGPKIANKVYIENGSQPTLSTDPNTKAEQLFPEQIAAVQMYRLQAIRALARFRNDTIGGKAKPAYEVRPIFTLARVVVGDPSITPALNKKEVAEAVLGLIRVNPSANINLDELAYAVSYGLRVVYSTKAANSDDTSLPWKGLSGRMTIALQDWLGAISKAPRLVPKQKESISSLVKKATDGLFNPAINPTVGAGGINPVKLELIDDWQRDNPPANDRQLFSDVKTFKLVYNK
jgi:hypothetical protein